MNNFTPITVLSGIAVSLFPAAAHAQVNDVFGLAEWVHDLFFNLQILFWALAVMLFIWGVVKFIANANDTAEHAKGKQFIVWGIIAFVVLVSLWGIVEIVLSGTFGFGDESFGEIEFIDKDDNTL